ncbi:MAG: DUF6498-containing protein [Gammaproteobacteria bacterium]
MPPHQTLLSIGSFVVTLALACLQHWSATDLVWSMWIASLATGYALILTTVIGDLTRRRDSAASGGGVAAAVVTLLFFSAHFLLFHSVQGLILNGFFPLLKRPQDGLQALLPLAAAALQRYWPLVLTSAVTMLASFHDAWRTEPSQFMARPYASVARNHVMIFVVAGMDALGAGALVLYGLLVLYFFPFQLLRTQRRGQPR